jgi:NAD+ synthase (glutamine-hydrolysing)
VFSAFDGEQLWAFIGEIPVEMEQAVITCENMTELSLGIVISDDEYCADSMSESLAISGADVIVNISAIAEVVGMANKRREYLRVMSEKLCCGYVLACAGDGESTTDCVFAGHNIICENGKILAESKPFENGILISEIDVKKLSFERRRRGFETQQLIEGNYCFSLNEEKTILTRKISKYPFIPC